MAKRIATGENEYEKGVLKEHLESARARDAEEAMSTPDERFVGMIKSAEYGEEACIIDEITEDTRQCYTMPDLREASWTKAYGLCLRGEGLEWYDSLSVVVGQFTEDESGGEV